MLSLTTQPSGPRRLLVNAEPTYNSTSRQTIEDFLLRRSAEVTVQSGFTHFVFDTRDTEAKTYYHSDFAGWPGWPGYGWYWHSWDFARPINDYPVTRYDAYSEIVMLNADQAKSEPRAIRAQDVLDHLAQVPAH